jgi:hypothetical protein
VITGLRDIPYVASLGALLAVTVCALALVLSQGGDEDALASGAPSPPAATATRAAATSVPTPVPTVSAASLADTKRLLDLDALSVALERFQAWVGAYPTTGGAYQTVCTRAQDAGCVLLRSEPELSLVDGEGEPYWYQSDGTTYTLLAGVVVAPANSKCPAALPQALASLPVACITGGAP